MTTFALIHGAYHGAWCWNLVAPLLERHGHRTVAVDLPTDDVAAGLDAYATLVVEALASHDDDVVVVGHSMGGLVAPVVADRRPVDQVIFLCSPIPEAGLSMNAQRERDEDMMLGALQGHIIDCGDGTRACDEAGARHAFLHACPDLVAEWAVRLMRPQSGTPTADPVPVEALPDVAYQYIVAADDRMISPDWSRRKARELLAVEPVEITGGHDPMLSAPLELARMLLDTTSHRTGGKEEER